jgi:hypothetical protein
VGVILLWLGVCVPTGIPKSNPCRPAARAVAAGRGGAGVRRVLDLSTAVCTSRGPYTSSWAAPVAAARA